MALGVVVRRQAAVQRFIIAPGALLVVLSGLILTFSVSGRSGELVGFNLALVVMQAAGILGALLSLMVALPTAARLGRLEPTGPGAAYFDELRQRQKVVTSIAGMLGLIALVAGAWCASRCIVKPGERDRDRSPSALTALPDGGGGPSPAVSADCEGRHGEGTHAPWGPAPVAAWPLRGKGQSAEFKGSGRSW